ncbi:hypothetical protein [Methylococcus sp. EFPC2]|uniref:hypothetical protein n=1 Tax=Methylococcus sp. EFPC2 TaxID=2812648 RepID=UPI0019688F42|nr:hypothetical protein [Methylococcus sp. EFPC2]QSA96192.1 hypothetical protein JWZ97_13260 [Methylococcus sp. EFPC2]
MSEFYKRAHIGLALVIGFFSGKYLAQTMGHHGSEFFSGGFMLGFIVSRYLLNKLFGSSSD